MGGKGTVAAAAMVHAGRTAAPQPKLPDLSVLGLARTGMEAPGEAADAYEQYLVTPDFFITVLEQIENISDLTKACDVVKTWCGADQARNRACKSPAAKQAWQSLCRKLFSPSVPEPSPNVSWMQHFTSLCNTDPVKRLVRIGLARAETYEAQLRARMAAAADDGDVHVLEDVPMRVVERLVVEAGLAQPADLNEPVTPGDRWTTERDDRVDVAAALTQIARRKRSADSPAVQSATINAILHVVHALSRRDGNMNDLAMERLSYLVGWLLFQNPPEADLVPLVSVRNEIAGYLYLALVRTTWGHVQMDHDDAFRRTNLALNALKEIACRGGNVAIEWSLYATPPLQEPGTSVQTASNVMVHYLVHGNDAMKLHICTIIAESLHMTPQQVGIGLPDVQRKVQFANNLVTFGALEALPGVGRNVPDLAQEAIRACASIARQLAMRR